MITISTLSWTVSLICIIGCIFNVNHSVVGFWCWTVGNTAWLIYDIYTGLYGRAALDFMQLVLSLYGIVAWTKEYKLSKPEIPPEGFYDEEDDFY